MLVSFRIQNSRSIVDLTLPMAYAEKKAPNGYREMEMQPFFEKGGKRVIPCLALYGPNASGKSNIVKAFGSFIAIIRDRHVASRCTINKLHALGESTIFTLDFIGKQGHVYTYRLEVNAREIVAEELYQGPMLIYSVEHKKLRAEVLVDLLYTEERLKNILHVECLDPHGRHHIAFLTVLGKNYAGLNAEISEVYSFLTDHIDVYTSPRLPFMYGVQALAQTLDSGAFQDAFAEIARLLQKLDIDINRMEYSQREWDESNNNGDTPFYEFFVDRISNAPRIVDIFTYHNDVKGNEARFDFADESDGTKRAACLLGIILSVLKRGGVLIVDELGISLHPLLLVEIVRLFKDRRYNKTGAQLIFTTHGTDILDQELLRISEVGIVSKTVKMGTKLARISDFDGVRNVTNFRKQYLEGRFSGLPFPYI